MDLGVHCASPVKPAIFFAYRTMPLTVSMCPRSGFRAVHPQAPRSRFRLIDSGSKPVCSSQVRMYSTAGASCSVGLYCSSRPFRKKPVLTEFI